jgi:molecular chaperone DnaJ
MDYYEILGVEKNATKEQIKQALGKSKKISSDVNKEEGAEEKFKEIGRAYETLMDDNKRDLYDRLAKTGLKMPVILQGLLILVLAIWVHF